MSRMITLLLLLAGWILFSPTMASAGQCDRCGCQSRCQRVCRVVCEMQEVKKTCYKCECEEFCLPGPSKKCGEVCECDPCNPGTGCGWLDCLLGKRPCQSCRNVWKPSCDVEIRSRNKLYKKEIVKKVPTYKWVVEYCCPDCCAAGDGSPKEAAVTDAQDEKQTVSN